MAAELRDARVQRRPMQPITSRYPSLAFEEASAIQHELRELETADGAVLVGHKIGATSTAIQEMFGIDHPDFGFLTDRMLLRSSAVLTIDHFIAPLVEAEIAFRMATDLAGEDVTAQHVLTATAEVFPVLEVLDSRIADWKIQLGDTVADNASCAVVVMGEPVPVTRADLAAETMVLEVDGQVVRGNGAAVLGHPAESVAFLVRMLAAQGRGLRADELVLAGAWASALTLRAGSRARAVFENLGSVSLSVHQ
ncbi:2-keto-4-pentenoate hydratase [Catenulispora sp. GAS73]|uniref:2-keto-4-pentenoate hydratase n=1 Tax=Catenulispora sp. GAS73 TaxID=3156269 RepID=UPI003515D1BD